MIDRDPRARSQAGGDVAMNDPPQVVVPDILMRAAPDGGWIIELNPRDAAARAGERALLRARRAARGQGRNAAS